MKTASTGHKQKLSALVICNGEVLPIKETAPLLREKPFIVCADGGADKARKLGIRPHLIIGDLDSVSRSTRAYFSAVETIRVEDQYSTDLEKALDYPGTSQVPERRRCRCDGREARPCVFEPQYFEKISWADSSFVRGCIVRYPDHRQKGSFRAEARIGRIAAAARTLRRNYDVWTRFPLRNEALELGVREGTSNRVVSSPVKISVRKGSLALFVVKQR